MSLAIHLTARHMQNLREILKATRANSCKLNFLLQLRIDWRFWLWEYQMTLELDKQLAKASKSRQSCKFSPTWALSTFHWGPILMKYWFRVRLYKCTAGWIGSIREANFDWKWLNSLINFAIERNNIVFQKSISKMESTIHLELLNASVTSGVLEETGIRSRLSWLLLLSTSKIK